MSGSGKAQLRQSYVPEATAGAIPATPAFIYSPFEKLNLDGPPNIKEDRNASSGFRRDGVGRSGYTVTGKATGPIRYGYHDAWLASLLQGTWTSDVLKDGLDARTTFSVEDSVPAGVGGTETMVRFRGVEPIKMELNLKADDDASIMFDLIGTGADAATETAISGATYTPLTKKPKLGSGSDIGSISISGGDPLPCFESMKISVDMDGKKRQPKLASDDLCGVGRGAAIIEITAALYIEDGVLEIYNKARTGTEFVLTLNIGVTTGEKYTLEFHRCQFVAAPIDTESDDLFQNVTIYPLYDETEDCIVTITRAVT